MEAAPVGPVDAVVEAANNFFNNPLSAVQPNVFQNIIPGVKEAIERLLYEKLKVNLPNHRELQTEIKTFLEDIKKAKAVIAGGFVLAAIEMIPYLNKLKEIDADASLSLLQKRDAKETPLFHIGVLINRITDIDVYVSIDSFSYLFGRAFETDTVGYFAHDDGTYSKFRSSIYCESFLRRNGIKAVHRYMYPRSRRYGEADGFHFDVMAVRNKKSPLQVVNNFDLTFCQVWFDGNDCYATFPDHVRKKEGWVQKEYLPVLFRGNHFIKDRIKKYRRRGYRILQNPELTPELAKAILNKSTEAVLDSPPSLCDSVTKPVKRYDDPEFLRNWAIRMILDDLSTYKHEFDRPERYMRALITAYKFGYHGSRHDVPEIPAIKRIARYGWAQEAFAGINPDDGYDTEDYVEDADLGKLKTLTVTVLDGEDFAEGINAETADETTKTLVFYRLTNSILKYLYELVPGKRDYVTEHLGETLTDDEQEIFEFAPKLRQASKKYLTALRDICLRKATEDLHFASEGDVVYDIHMHSLDKAISAEVLEGYLNQYIGQPDHESVPCYQFIAGDPSSCQKQLTFNDIRYIVSPEYFANYTKPAPIKTGLNQSVAGLNITLENTKSEDPAGFGEIYHYTMCPFCLQLENRDEGCAYMTHANPKRRPEEDTPYCQDHFLVPEIRDRYIAAGTQIFEDRGLQGLALHMEFCIECGRPCLNHEHFDLNDPPNLIPSHNPGICDGGGRAELFARILAVRQVYRDGGFTDPKAERLAAAQAADAAPRNADLMARGQVISDMPPPERIWGNADVPTRKDYNDPAYGQARAENNNAGSENSFNAAAYGFGENEEEKVPEDGDAVGGPAVPPPAGGKRKKAKGYRLTRKMGKQHYRKSKATKRH
jgi:hypothetical protein